MKHLFSGIAVLILASSLGVSAQAQAPTSSTLAPPAEIRVVKLTDETDYIEHWYVCGQFPFAGSPPLIKRWSSVAALPDKDSFFRELYQGETAKIGWRETEIVARVLPVQPTGSKLVISKEGRIVDFFELYRQIIGKSAYALCFLDSPAARTRTMAVGSDDGIRIWLNGELIHENQIERPLAPDEDAVPAKFRKGLNVLLVEVNNKQGRWSFMLRFKREVSKDLPLTRAKGE